MRVGASYDDTLRNRPHLARKDKLSYNNLEGKAVPFLINITEGSHKEVIPLMRALLMIGRGDDSNLEIGSNEVSRNHASIVRYGDHYCLRDNGSTNGSYVNGKRVAFRQLEHLDIVRFGDHRFLVDFRDEIDPKMKPHKDHLRGNIPKVTIGSTHDSEDTEDYRQEYDLEINNVDTPEMYPIPIESEAAMHSIPYPAKRSQPIHIIARGKR